MVIKRITLWQLVIYIYTQLFRKVLWVVLSSLVSKKFEKLAGEAVDLCLREPKEINKSRFDSYSQSGTVYWSYPIFSFRIVACSFATTFLGIAAYIFKRSCSSISSLLSSFNMRVVFHSLTFSVSSNPLRSACWRSKSLAHKKPLLTENSMSKLNLSYT